MSIMLQQHTWEAFISSFTAVSLHRNMVGTLQFFFTAVLFIIFRNQIVLLSSYPEKTVCFSVWFGYPSITKYLAMKTYLAKSTRHLDTVLSPAITLFPHWSVNNTRAYNCTHHSISVQVPSPEPFTWMNICVTRMFCHVSWTRATQQVRSLKVMMYLYMSSDV